MRFPEGVSQQLLRRLPSPHFTPALSVALYMDFGGTDALGIQAITPADFLKALETSS
jgi:hypothetical protein